MQQKTYFLKIILLTLIYSIQINADVTTDEALAKVILDYNFEDVKKAVESEANMNYIIPDYEQPSLVVAIGQTLLVIN